MARMLTIRNRTSGTYWNYTAYAVSSYNQFVAPLLTFTMEPTEIWGVA